MYETYKNLVTLSELYIGGEENCQIAENYQRTGDPVYLAEIFCRYFPFIQTTSEKYFYLTEADKASFAIEELHKSILDYDSKKGAKIQTLFITYYNNRLRTETQALNLQKRKANNNCDSYEHAATLFEGYADKEFAIIELQEALEQSGMLSDNELAYCKIIMSSDNIKDIDVARNLDISPSAVHQLKSRLRKKIDIESLIV